MLRLLVITAHPDDEAGGFGGALRLYRERGVETYVICLTPGQAASNRGGATSDEELSAMRRVEFASACELLKIFSGEVLEYRDGQLDRADFATVAADLTRRIRQIKPQVVLTFGTEGAVTAHPDHTMTALFATAAFHWASRGNRFPDQLTDHLQPYQPQKLYYVSSNLTLPDRQPVALPPWSCVLDIAPFLDKKIDAFKRHTSQAPLFARFEETMRKRGGKELYHLTASAKLHAAEAETDLFAGVEDR